MADCGPRNEPADGRNDEPADVVSNTALALVTQVVTAGLTAVLTLYLTRKLGPRSFGEFSLAVSVVGVMLVVADGGISASSGRFLAEQRRDRQRVVTILANALTLKLIVALTASVALFALAAPLAHAYADPDLTWPFRAVAIVLFTQSLMAYYSNALVSVERISANLAIYTAESIAETLASVALVALGGGAGGAAFGRAIGYAVGAVAAIWLSARVFGRRALVPAKPNRGVVGPIVRYAGVMFVVSGAWTLFSQVDVLLIGAYVGSAEVGLFSAPLRLCTVLHYPGLAIQNSVAPRLARGPGREPDVRSFQVALRGLVILQAAMLAPVLVWASPIIDLLLGSGYARSAEVLRALAPFVFMQGLGPVISVGVNYLGGSRRRIRIAVAAFLIDLLLDVLLIPRIGALGGAIATSVAYALYVPAHLLICRDLLGISLRPLTITSIRALIASAGAAGVLWLTGTSSLSLSDWLLGGAGAAAAFIGLLLLSREVSPSDFRRLARAVARLARSRTG
ncbi:MAG: oligosaccharide flippase family protein [Solirubrobacteraceae bacterium]